MQEDMFPSANGTLTRFINTNSIKKLELYKIQPRPKDSIATVFKGNSNSNTIISINTTDDRKAKQQLHQL